MVKYWLWLTTRRGLGARGAWLVANYFRTPEAAYLANETVYASIPGIKNWDGLLDKDLSYPERIVQQCRTLGIGILTIQDAAYPIRLKSIDDPPLVLYHRGRLPDLNGPAVAVVGTRAMSAYGATHAYSMGYNLSACGCTVISGGAKGVDTEALKGALQGGTPPVAVLGGGVDVVFPAQNRNLFHDIASYGCLLSEYPPGTECHSHHFPVRNRIISGLSLGVLVVEAPQRSGAILTAMRALDQGRDVFTIPANLGNAGCAGNLKLLQDGAILAADAWDILREYKALYPNQLRRRACSPLVPQEEPPETPPEPAAEKPSAVSQTVRDQVAQLQGDEKLLAQILLEGPMYADALMEASQLPSGRVLASLTLLEVKGIIHRPGPKRYALTDKTV